MIRILIAICCLANVNLMPNFAQAQEDPDRMLALNLYHEARGEGREGMIAVGWVVLNRIEDSVYPDNVLDVITQTRGRNCEWGWWCDGKSDKPTEPEMWALAQSLAAELMSANPPADPTQGALWFNETFRDRPSWMGDDVERSATLGGHHFYRRK